jgi:acetylornithine deacetylase
MSDEIRARVLAEIDARRDEIVTLLADLVRIPSVNRRPYGDELACQRHIEGIFRGMGLEIDVFRPDEVTGIQENRGWAPGAIYENRPNVVGTRRGTGGGKSLLLLGHVDVVPEGPHELWRHGPFNPTIEGDRLVGRGSNDDKGGIAAFIAALQCLEAAGLRARGDVILASVVDEESAGANGTLAVLQRPHIADAAVYCDGLNLEIHPSNLGGINARVEVQMRPEKAGVTISGVMPAVVAVYEALNAFGVEREACFEQDERYAGTAWPAYAVRISHLTAGSTDGGNPGGGSLTVHAYVLPGEEPDEVLAMLRERVEQAASGFPDLLPSRVEPFGRIMPASAIPFDAPFVDLVAACYEEASGKPAKRTGMPMSDYFQFILNSPKPMPTVAMGPGRWGPEGAHEANESVLIDEHLIPFVKTLALLIIDWCGVEAAA